MKAAAGAGIDGADVSGDEAGADGAPTDSQQAWLLADEARARGQWARVSKLVRLARSGNAGK